MNEPVDSPTTPLEKSQSGATMRSVVRIGGLTLGIFAIIAVVFGKMIPDTVLDSIEEVAQFNSSDYQSGSIMDSALGQAFAADFNNHDDPTMPIAVYPETEATSQDDPKKTAMTAEELKERMQELQQEIEVMEQQGYDIDSEIDLSETVSLKDDDTSFAMTETVLADIPEIQSQTLGTIANPRWEEPLTPPRWGEQYGEDFNREGVIVPLSRPEQTAWLTVPQWKRTERPSQYQEQYAQYDGAENIADPQQSGHFRIQLGSFRSAGSAKSGWRQLLSQNSDILGVLDHSVEQADLGSRGIYYRVQAGSFANADVAKVICDEVKARNADCLVVRR